MKKVIWKFPLVIEDVQIIELPRNYEILTIQVQNGIACLWAMVSPEVPKEKIIIEIICTWEPFSIAERQYIGTFQVFEEQLVFHVFKRL